MLKKVEDNHKECNTLIKSSIHDCSLAFLAPLGRFGSSQQMNWEQQNRRLYWSFFCCFLFVRAAQRVYTGGLAGFLLATMERLSSSVKGNSRILRPYNLSSVFESLRQFDGFLSFPNHASSKHTTCWLTKNRSYLEKPRYSQVVCIIEHIAAVLVSRQ
jgi:hypothetical protein